MNGTSNLARANIKALYETLDWYSQNPGVGKAPLVLQYYDLWRDLHTLSVNISGEGWKALEELAWQDLGIALRSREQQWRFLFAVETYLNILIRAMALSKLGRTPSTIKNFKNKIDHNRNIFSPSVFEWIFLAVEDVALNNNIRRELQNALIMLLQTISTINIATLSFDSFRVLYQNILPRELRRSLGEFYTNENIVNEVLDAAGLDCNRIKELYERWSTSRVKRQIRILDPACGSGSFLVSLIRRIFSCLHCRPDIVEFIESIIYGVDINPFAAEMARLNVMLAISDGLQATCRHSVYAVRQINVFWGDSLAVALEAQYPTGDRVLKLRIPSIARFLGSPEEEILLPHPDVINPINAIDGVIEYLSSNKSPADFIKDYLKDVPDETKGAYRNVLAETWNIISSIIKAGNSRAIELLKSSLRILGHMGQVDYVIGNPPWVRVHEISKPVRERLRRDFKFYRQGSSYDPRFGRTRTPFKSQQDYSMAFVERGLNLLKPGGTLSYVITSKILKTTYAGRLRETLLRDTTILRLMDYSLYPVPLFEDVVNYPLVIAVKKNKPQKEHGVNVTIYNTAGDRKDFHVEQEELPLDKRDYESPWILAPGPVVGVYRKLQSMGTRFGDAYEIMMGVKTSANDLYIIRRILGCQGGVVRVELEGGAKAEVEEWLVHPMVRGEDIDPFTHRVNYYIIFPHDPQTLDPIWDPVQKQILNVLGVLSKKWRVRASGQALVYESKNSKACAQLLQRVNYFTHGGWTLKKLQPCRILACLEIGRSGSSLKINVERHGNACRVYVEGLKIPNAPHATQHFMRNLERLVRRDDYKISYPPWTVFRVTKRKFRGYRIAWQENVKYFEASYLQVATKTNLCSNNYKLLVPIQTVYFISEVDKCRSLAILLYLNSNLARSILKLIAWSARGGHFRHISYTVGQLPLPIRAIEEKLRALCDDRDTMAQSGDLNDLIGNLPEKAEQMIVESLGLDRREYEEVIGFGKWLNETANIPFEATEVESDYGIDYEIEEEIL